MELVLSARNIPNNNSRNMRKIKILKVKGVKLQRKKGPRLSDDERKDEGLYNELKAWKPASGS